MFTNKGNFLIGEDLSTSPRHYWRISFYIRPCISLRYSATDHYVLRVARLWRPPECPSYGEYRRSKGACWSACTSRGRLACPSGPWTARGVAWSWDGTYSTNASRHRTAGSYCSHRHTRGTASLRLSSLWLTSWSGSSPFSSLPPLPPAAAAPAAAGLLSLTVEMWRAMPQSRRNTSQRWGLAISKDASR